MKAVAVNKKRVGRQHPDHNQRPDDGVIWLRELVIDPRHPKRIPAIKISRAVLWKNIKRGLFPEPVVGRRGWLLGEVRKWIRDRAASELPLPDSAQSTTKLFSAVTPGTRGGNLDAVRRVERPAVTAAPEGRDATPLYVPGHDHNQGDAGGQVESAKARSGQKADAAQTASDGSATVGEPYDVRQLLRSISEGATA